MSDIIADIIMPTWNQFDMLRRAVALIRKNTIVPYRLIVCDGASTDGTGEWLTKQDDITAIIPAVNEGHVTAWNRGLEISTAPYTCLMSDDVEVGGRGWLKILIEALEHNPAVGVMTAREAGVSLAGINPEGQVSITAEVVGGLFGCTVMKREIWQDIGLLDERFNWATHVDADYAARLQRKGWKIGIHHGVNVKHWPMGVATKAAGVYNERVARGKIVFKEKYPGRRA